jgi:hypothetical protein
MVIFVYCPQEESYIVIQNATEVVLYKIFLETFNTVDPNAILTSDGGSSII